MAPEGTKSPARAGDSNAAFGRAPQRLTRPSRGGLTRGAKLPERVAAAIVHDIVSQGLEPGDRLPKEAEMQERFAVGRGSLREALRILEVHGVISLRSGPNGGPIVTDVNEHDVARTFSLYLNIRGAKMQELVEARLFIEPMAARMAAGNRDPKSLQRLRDAVAYEASIPDGDPRYVEAANNLHYAIGSMTGNHVVDLLSTSLKELYTTRFVSSGIAPRTTEPTIRNEHREIAEAILAGDPDRAEDLMRSHMIIYVDRLKQDPASFLDELVTWD